MIKKGTMQQRQKVPDNVVIVALCREGNQNAMKQLYEAFRVPLFNIICRFTNDYGISEELLHDVFVAAFKRIKTLKKPSALKGWLCRIAINACISHSRKVKREKLDLHENMEQFEVSLSGKGYLAHDIERAMKEQPPKLKAVFILHDVQGFSHLEIADIMSCKVGTSKSQLFKARKKMRRLLASVCPQTQISIQNLMLDSHLGF